MRKLAKTGAIGLALLAATAPVRADEADENTAIDAQLFKPALDPRGIFSVERSGVPRQWDYGLRLGVTFAQSPLSLATVEMDDDADSVIDTSLAFELSASLGLTKRLVFAFSTVIMRQSLGSGYGDDARYRPIAPSMSTPGTGFYSLRPEQNVLPSKTPVGDARLGFKYRLTGKPEGETGLAAQIVTYVPFGDEDVFAGSAGFTFEPKLIYDLGLGEGALVVNAGARIREGVLSSIAPTTPMGGLLPGDNIPVIYVGSEALLALAFTHPVGSRLDIAAEVSALYPITKADDGACEGDCINGDPAALGLLGIAFAMGPDLTMNLGGGAGIPIGEGRGDAFRVFLGLDWAPTPEGARPGGRGDSDGDGIGDGPDVCPDEPEDVDTFQDDDGCPELDNDLDGVLDATDLCPNEPEDRDGHEDADGCPEGDNDNDSVADLTDRCPAEAEDSDGFQDDDGCPDEDNDGDGVPDRDDKCSNDPETVNGYLDLDGCPDQSVQGGPRLTEERVDLRGERIEFVGNTARLTERARDTLDAVAEILGRAENRNIRIRIEVGVEQSGTSKPAKAKDKRLTQERAAAVEQYLVSKGVSRTQLDSVGLGSDRPLDPTKPGDAGMNRRVEFIRVTQ